MAQWDESKWEVVKAPKRSAKGEKDKQADKVRTWTYRRWNAGLELDSGRCELDLASPPRHGTRPPHAPCTAASDLAGCCWASCRGSKAPFRLSRLRVVPCPGAHRILRQRPQPAKVVGVPAGPPPATSFDVLDNLEEKLEERRQAKEREAKEKEEGKSRVAVAAARKTLAFDAIEMEWDTSQIKKGGAQAQAAKARAARRERAEGRWMHRLGQAHNRVACRPRSPRRSPARRPRSARWPSAAPASRSPR